MDKPYDGTLKFLLESYPRDLLGNLFGLPLTDAPIQHLQTELQADTRTADAVLQVDLPGEPATLIHVEVQSRYDPQIPLRLLDYAVRIHQKYERRVRSWPVQLLPFPTSWEPFPTEVGWGNPNREDGLLFRYHVVRVWELEPALGLAHPGLMPLFPLMRHEQRPPELLDRCVARLEEWQTPTDERERLLECLGSLASLRYDRNTVMEWLGRLHMIETPLMDWLRAEGKAEGKTEGKAEDILKILAARGFQVPDAIEQKIRTCQDLELLDRWLTRAVTAASLEEVFS